MTCHTKHANEGPSAAAGLHWASVDLAVVPCFTLLVPVDGLLCGWNWWRARLRENHQIGHSGFCWGDATVCLHCCSFVDVCLVFLDSEMLNLVSDKPLLDGGSESHLWIFWRTFPALFVATKSVCFSSGSQIISICVQDDFLTLTRCFCASERQQSVVMREKWKLKP